MRLSIHRVVAIAAAALLSVAGCRENPPAEPTAPEAKTAAVQAKAAASPRERAVLAAMEEYEQAILDSDTAALGRIWIEGYTFINPLGVIVTRAQRLANIGSGSTDVQI